jgi:hypothetical protein
MFFNKCYTGGILMYPHAIRADNDMEAKGNYAEKKIITDWKKSS